MSTHYNGCMWSKHGMLACDLAADRETLCTACLTYLVQRDRPPGWTPRVKKESK